MRVPPTVSPDWPRVSDDIDVGVPLHPRLEIPRILVKLVAHQVQQAIRKVAQRQRLAGKPAGGRCAGRHGCQHGDDNERRCDEKWQDSNFFTVSQWIHCSCLSVVLIIAMKRSHVDGYCLCLTANQMSLPPKPLGRVEKK